MSIYTIIPLVIASVFSSLCTAQSTSTICSSMYLLSAKENYYLYNTGIGKIGVAKKIDSKKKSVFIEVIPPNYSSISIDFFKNSRNRDKYTTVFILDDSIVVDKSRSNITLKFLSCKLSGNTMSYSEKGKYIKLGLKFFDSNCKVLIVGQNGVIVNKYSIDNFLKRLRFSEFGDCEEFHLTRESAKLLILSYGNNKSILDPLNLHTSSG